MASPWSSLWRNLSHFVLCVIFGMHPLCHHLPVFGMPRRRDAGGRALALRLFDLGGVLHAWGPVQELAEARSVNLQLSFQGWEGRCEEAALLRGSENQPVQVQMSSWHCGDPCQR